MEDLWLSPHDARVRALRDGGGLVQGGFASPFGSCTVLSDETRILALHFTDGTNDQEDALWSRWTGEPPPESETAVTLAARAFESPAEVPLLAVGTPFQLTVWEFLRNSLRSNPGRLTLTYGELAREIGRPSAARAVGQAVGANEIALLIPCHRVVSRGKLTGYRWGVFRKKALLARELSQKDPLELPF